ncbi:mediator of RNA polymerase II transcription subunit 22-like isoform X2 [Bolinopsis microptera]|uniref:mediator of RNA polymerase II transcription subunit 22-like isoform X2 n=1 Tax=Bolinopsis microptera TaxID=2820187 RepID=UPI0030794242
MLPSSRVNSTKEVHEAYARRLTESTNAMISNYTAIVKSLKVEDDSRLSSTNQAFQDNYEANVRCTNIIKAGQSLLTLISDLKECLIFKDFPAINQSLASQKELLEQNKQLMNGECDKIKEEVQILLYELETECYS